MSLDYVSQGDSLDETIQHLTAIIVVFSFTEKKNHQQTIIFNSN